MGRRVALLTLLLAFCLELLTRESRTQAADLWPFVLREQRTIEVRDPAELPPARIPETPPPRTVRDPRYDEPQLRLSLDDALRIALENSEVVRVLAGVTAVSSGSTIYDAAIANTAVDRQRARFDPNVEVQNNFNRDESPQAFFDPADPLRTQIAGTRTDDYDLNLGLSKTTITGGEARVDLGTNAARFQPGIFPLNPRNRSSLAFSFNQPLLQGGGIGPNLAPIVLARIDTERSYFQFKDSVQELVRGVVEGYWSLVFARTDVWARRQQVAQARFAYERAEAQLRVRIGNAADVAQTRVALANFRTNLIAAEANQLEREAALRNILGLPPNDGRQIVPVTAPASEQVEFNWDAVIRLAEQLRPDIIELKLILEADEQLLLQARNQAFPRVDAVMLYRWNGLEGEMPGGVDVATRPGQFTDWTLGVNFSVPLGLRQSRANMRQQELVIARDRANLNQEMHRVVHSLAGNIRTLSQFYAQYEAYKETREAALINLQQQSARYRQGLSIYLNVLLAINDWGNAVSNEAQSLTAYNSELANLERQTGTILEAHGIRFYEERFGSLGPLGRMHRDRLYPSALAPTLNRDRYTRTDEPAEQSFNLDDPALPHADRPGELLEPLPPVTPPGELPVPRSETTPPLGRYISY